jgi:hypothetical protein
VEHRHAGDVPSPYPRGPRSGPGCIVPVHQHLPGPIRPTCRHSAISPQGGLYALPSLCGSASATDEWFRAFAARSVSTCHPPRPRGVRRLHTPSSLTGDAGLHTTLTVRHSRHPTIRSTWASNFGATSVRSCCGLSTCLPPWRIRPGLRSQPTETFTSGLLTRRSPFASPGITTMAAGQLPSAGLPPAGTAASIAALGSRTGAVTHRPLLGCIEGFPLRARVEVAVIPFPVPAASHAACGFTALRAPAPFTSRVMRPPGSLRRDAQSSSQVLQRAGWVYQSTPAFRVDSDIGAARLLGSTGITPLHRYYEPSRRRLVFGRFPGIPGYTTYLAPPIARWDEDGFSSCSTCPCHRAAPNHPAGVASCLGQPTACHVAFAPDQGARPPESIFIEATTGFTYVAAR